MKLQGICVYCGSSTGDDPLFSEAAAWLGKAVAESGVRLIYGGGSIGLMGVLARSALRHGGEVVGIIPAFLKAREIALTEVSEMIVTDDMHTRKRAMFDRSDAFVALPGGIGTLEETVEMLTWIQLGQHQKPIVLVNLNGFWNPLIELFAQMSSAGFLPSAPGHRIVGAVDEVLPTIRDGLSQVDQSRADQGDAVARL